MIPTGDLTADLRVRLDALAPRGARLGLALSGGGDSMALLHLARAAGRDLRAVTIDHGQRDVSAELALCVRSCARLGVPHDVLRWSWDGQGNFQAAARAGRQRLIRDWARRHGLTQVLLAHTRDDQAETVLLRLGRGSGVDGLAGMEPRSGLWLRPLLDVSRAALRGWMTGAGVAWAEDPSNADPAYARVRARAMAGALADLGLTPERLLQLADHARAARISLREQAHEAALSLSVQGGDLLFPPALLDLSKDTPRRLLAAALGWIGGHDYRPRWQALTRAVAQARAGKATLAGCILRPDREGLRIGREPAACMGPVPAGQVWDGRWLVDSTLPGEVAALGAEGLAQCGDWRAAGLARDTLLASPGLWRDGRLIAAPVLGYGPAQAGFQPDFPGFLISH